jgi:hypothetical protein
MSRYILKGKTPVIAIDLMTWARWFETADTRVAKDTINKVDISTVFLGLDHRFGEGDPLLFETMIFRDGEGDECWRYSTWEQAETGHASAVAFVKRSMLKIVNGK